MPSHLDTALTGLAETAAQATEIARRQDHLVNRARHAGATWAQIAAALSISAQAAHKRYRHLHYDPATGRAWHQPPLAL